MRTRIDRAGFEGVHGMSIEPRHENNRRSACRVEAFHNVKSIGARHLNVEQKKIRRILFDRGKRLRGVAAFRDDFYFGLAGEQSSQSLTCDVFVVNDDSAKFHAAVRNGILILTMKPDSLSISREPCSP